MPRIKLSTNDPCPCGSRKKFKKCHPREFDKWGAPIPPAAVQDAAERFRNPSFPNHGFEPIVNHGVLTGRPFIDTTFKDKRARAVGRRVYLRPQNETFHEFLFNHLRDILVPQFGKEWSVEQNTLPKETTHPIYAWFQEVADITTALRETSGVPGISQVTMTGNIKALLALGYDFYTLEHHSVELRKEHWRRLKDVDQFQGVRYELAIAAMACRAGFRIEWCGGKDKRGEFIGTHTLSGQKLVFEAKSHGRDGVLGKKGSFDAATAKTKIMSHLRDALEQTEAAKLPLLLFDDLNLPISVEEINKQKWFKDVHDAFSDQKFDSIYKGTHYGGLIITNFAWHFHDVIPKKRENDVLSYWHAGGQYSIDAGIMRLLSDAAKQYGAVPHKLDEMLEGSKTETPPAQQAHQNG